MNQAERHGTRPTGPGRWLLAWFVGLLLIGCSDHPQSHTESRPMTEFTDFMTLERPASPNNWLVGPRDAPAGVEFDAVAPAFSMPASALAAAWQELLKTRPRTRILGVSADGLQIEAEQRSAVFGFADRVSFRAVPTDQGTSSLFVYSRSLVGYWDIGVNQRRVTEWLKALDPNLAPADR
ncbi:MAG: DUF1499 domain-containing protein [Chromatiaceae bacterium]|jgi:uncharacterized protein (DUF1499 family)